MKENAHLPMWTDSPKTDLRITLVQDELQWANPAANRDLFSVLLAPLRDSSDLILLPEMFTSGFALDETGFDPILEYKLSKDWMLEQAGRLNSALCGSLLYVDEQGKRFNRLVFATPERDLWHYDKTHLFRMAGEHERYHAGVERKIFVYRGWRILSSICYDIRFPVFLRNRGDYDLLLCPANWPSARRTAWRTLLQARAIENLAYVAGTNRIGTDGNGLSYSGDSVVFDFRGEALIDKNRDEPFIATTKLSASKLATFREKFPAWRDADDFELKNILNPS